MRGLLVFNARVRLGPRMYRLASSTTLSAKSTGSSAGMPEVEHLGWAWIAWSERMIRTTLIIYDIIINLL